jgi:hypothetical protein
MESADDVIAEFAFVRAVQSRSLAKRAKERERETHLNTTQTLNVFQSCSLTTGGKSHLASYLYVSFFRKRPLLATGKCSRKCSFPLRAKILVMSDSSERCFFPEAFSRNLFSWRRLGNNIVCGSDHVAIESRSSNSKCVSQFYQATIKMPLRPMWMRPRHDCEIDFQSGLPYCRGISHSVHSLHSTFFFFIVSKLLIWQPFPLLVTDWLHFGANLQSVLHWSCCSIHHAWSIGLCSKTGPRSSHSPNISTYSRR